MVEINGKRYHHIIDPRIGWPADKCISATVIADDAQTADTLATAVFVLGPKDGIEFCERLSRIEAAVIASDFSVTYSSGFPVALERKEEK